MLHTIKHQGQKWSWLYPKPCFSPITPSFFKEKSQAQEKMTLQKSFIWYLVELHLSCNESLCLLGSSAKKIIHMSHCYVTILRQNGIEAPAMQGFYLNRKHAFLHSFPNLYLIFPQQEYALEMGLLTCLRDVEMKDSDLNDLILKEFWNKARHFSTDPEVGIAEAWNTHVLLSFLSLSQCKAFVLLIEKWFIILIYFVDIEHVKSDNKGGCYGPQEKQTRCGEGECTLIAPRK